MAGKLIYLGGSMANRDGIRQVALAVREAGHTPFVDWIMPGEEADAKWREFAETMGYTYRTALASPHATNVFEFDQRWLGRADAFVLVLPAGRSAHLEAGYMVGKGKPVCILLEEDHARWDVMYLFAGLVTNDLGEMLDWLGEIL